MAKWGSSEIGQSDISTLLSKDTEIRGTIKTQGSIRIDGTVIGDVHSAKTATVGNSGFVEGNVHADEIIVSGKVKGSLIAKGKIALESSAQLDGDINAARLTIAEGAAFRGISNMGAPAFKSTPQTQLPTNGQSKVGDAPRTVDKVATS